VGLLEALARHVLGDRGEIQPVQDHGVAQRSGFDPFAEQQIETDEPWGESRDARPTADAGSADETANAIASYLDRHWPSAAAPRPAIVPRPEGPVGGRSLRDEASRPPAMKIHIGQIRVDGPAATPAPRARFARPRPKLGLGDFIERRPGR
jgi:hypothetical protein